MVRKLQESYALHQHQRAPNINDTNVSQHRRECERMFRAAPVDPCGDVAGAVRGCTLHMSDLHYTSDCDKDLSTQLYWPIDPTTPIYDIL